MEKCYFGVNNIGAPLISWEFDDKDNFDKFGDGTKTGFAMISPKEEVEQLYLLVRSYGSDLEYHITIVEGQDEVSVKVVFDASEETVLSGRCKKNKGFLQFVKAFKTEDVSNIYLDIILTGTQFKKTFHTLAFTKNEFATLKECSKGNQENVPVAYQ